MIALSYAVVAFVGLGCVPLLIVDITQRYSPKGAREHQAYLAQFHELLAAALVSDQGLTDFESPGAFSDNMSWAQFGISNGFGAEVAQAQQAKRARQLRRQRDGYIEQMRDCMRQYEAAATAPERINAMCKLSEQWARAWGEAHAEAIGLIHELRNAEGIWDKAQILKILQQLVNEHSAELATRALEDHATFLELYFFRAQIDQSTRGEISIPANVTRYDFGRLELAWVPPANWVDLVHKHIRMPSLWDLGQSGISSLRLLENIMTTLLRGSSLDAQMCQAWLVSGSAKYNVPDQLRTAIHAYAYTGRRPDTTHIFGN